MGWFEKEDAELAEAEGELDDALRYMLWRFLWHLWKVYQVGWMNWSPEDWLNAEHGIEVLFVVITTLVMAVVPRASTTFTWERRLRRVKQACTDCQNIYSDIFRYIQRFVI